MEHKRPTVILCKLFIKSPDYLAKAAALTPQASILSQNVTDRQTDPHVAEGSEPLTVTSSNPLHARISGVFAQVVGFNY